MIWKGMKIRIQRKMCHSENFMHLEFQILEKLLKIYQLFQWTLKQILKFV